MVRQNAALLGGVWRNDWGKLGYGIVASITVTGSKVLADQQIRMLLQSNPSLFPSAQQSITLYNIIGLSLVEIGSFILTVLLFRLLRDVTLSYGVMFVDMLDIFSFREMLGLPRRPRRFGNMISDLANTMAYFWTAMFVFSIVISMDSGFSEITGGDKAFNPAESLLIWSSFIRNGIGTASSAKVCTNLEPQELVSPFSTRDPMPNVVVAARHLRPLPLTGWDEPIPIAWSPAPTPETLRRYRPLGDCGSPSQDESKRRERRLFDVWLSD